MDPCLRHTFRLFKSVGPAGNALSIGLVEDPDLCVSSDGPIAVGNILAQWKCNFTAKSQLWWINTNP
jgi:hypothetical protein